MTMGMLASFWFVGYIREPAIARASVRLRRAGRGRPQEVTEVVLHGLRHIRGQGTIAPG